MDGWAPQVSCSVICLWRSLKVSEPESPLGKMKERGHKIPEEYFWLRYQNSGSSRHSLEGATPPLVIIITTIAPLPKRWSFLSWTPSAWGDLGERLGKGHFKASVMPWLFSPQLLYIPHPLTPHHSKKCSPSTFLFPEGKPFCAPLPGFELISFSQN